MTFQTLRRNLFTQEGLNEEAALRGEGCIIL